MNSFEAECRFLESAAGSTLGLAEGALLIAAMETGEVDVRGGLEQLEMLADQARPALEDSQSRAHALARLALLLGDTAGFHGNAEAYQEIENSYLHKVLERRTGIPVTLSVVWIEVGRAAGLPLAGVGMPLHFLVGVEDDGDLFADPFDRGRVLDVAGCAELLAARSGGNLELEPSMLRPIPDHLILFRILVNLRSAHVQADRDAAALRATSAMIALQPHVDELYRDRGVLALRMGDGASAEADIEAYLLRRPDAEDVGTMRRLLDRATRRHLPVN